MEEKVIGIFSLNMHTKFLNYGSAIQSYALQTYLKQKGVPSVIIDYVPLHAEHYFNKNWLFHYRKVWHPITFFKRFRWGLSRWKRSRKFDKFFNLYYSKTKRCYLHRELLSIDTIEDLSFSAFICGSDTVWKLDQTKGFNDVFFLNIPSVKGKKKVAYACSMASRDFTKEEIASFQKLTKDFKGIGLREKSRVTQFNQYLDKPAIRVVDPTLLLNAEDYAKIAKLPKQEDYVLLY